MLPAHAQHAPVSSSLPIPPGNLRVWVEAPSSRTLRLRFENLDRTPGATERRVEFTRYLVAGSTLQAPAATIQRVRYLRLRGGDIVDSLEAGPNSASNQTLLSQAVRVLPAGRWRQFHTYALQISNVYQATATIGPPDAFILDFIELDLDLGPAPARPDGYIAEAAAFDGGASQPLFPGLLLNPEVDAAYLEIRTEQDWAPEKAWAKLLNDHMQRGGKALKIAVYEPGLYRLDATAWGLAGNQDTWRLFRRGQPVPILQPSSSTGPCFWAEPFDQIHQGRDTYFLLADAEPTTTATFAEISHPPDFTAASAEPTVVGMTATTEPLVDYHPRLRSTPDITRWYWTAVGNNRIADLDFDLPAGYSPAPGTSATVEIFYGYGDAPAAQPSIELLANRRGVTTGTAAYTARVVSLQATASTFLPGPNKLGIKIQYPPATPRTPDLLLQKIIVRWQQPADIRTGREPFHRIAPSSGTEHLIFRSQEAGDLRDRYLLVRMDPPQAFISPAAPTVSSAGLVAFLDSASTTSRYRVVELEGVTPPPVVERVTTMPLFESAPAADLVAITHRSLLPSLQPLLDHRAAQGHRVAAVDVDTIFDHFSYGNREPGAIRSFLRYAFYHWPAPKVRTAVLVGEASEYKGDPDRAPDGAISDLIPVNGGPRIESVRGDQPHTLFAGSDQLSDVLIGRIPVSTGDQLTSTIAKIIGFEKQPPSPWMLRSLIAFDDNDEFPEVVDKTIADATIPFGEVRRMPQDDHPYRPNMRVIYRRTSREATKALVDSFNSGYGILKFFGHGGPNLWSHERLLYLTDLDLFSNSSRLPLITCSSCDVAWFDYPVPPVERSLGERLMTMPGGGGIGVFAPVGGASPYEHRTLMTRLLTGVQRVGLRTLGEITGYASNGYFVDTNSVSIPEQYVLVGDPATRLPMPQVESALIPDNAVVPPATTTTIRLAMAPLPDTATSVGIAIHAVGKPAREDVGFVQSFKFTINSATVAALLPSEGLYAVALTYQVAGATHLRVGGLQCEQPRVVAEASQLNTPRVVPSGSRIDSRVAAKHLTGGIPVPVSLQGTFYSGPDSVTPHVSRALRVHGTALPGATIEWPLAFKANSTQFLRLQMDRPGAGATSIAPAALSVLTSSTGSAPRLVAAQPVIARWPAALSTTDIPRFSMEVANIGGTPFARLFAALYIRGEAVGSTVTVDSLVPMATRELTFTAASALPEGNHPLRLVVYGQNDAASTAAQQIVLEHTQTVRVEPGTDLVFTPGTARVRFPENPPKARSTIFVDAVLENRGPVSVSHAQLALLVGDPTTGTEAQTLNDMTSMNLAPLAPGEKRPVTFRWEDSAQVAGEKKVYLAVNRSRSIRESNFENNVIEIPPFTLGLYPNYKLVSLSAPAATLWPGTTCTLSATVMNDGDTTCPSLDVVLGFRHPLTGKEIRVTTAVENLLPAESRAIDVVITATEGINRAFAEVNAGRLHEELNPDDNREETAITILYDILPPDLQPASPIEVGTTLKDSALTNLEWIPGGAVRMADPVTSSLGSTPLDPSHFVASDDLPEGTTDALALARGWSLLPWRLTGLPGQTSGPIRLRIPGALSQPGLQHEVHLFVLGGSGLEGGRAGNFSVRIEDEATTRLIAPPATTPNPVESRVFVGRFDLRDDALDLEVDTVPPDRAAIVAVELRPVLGRAVSPVMPVPAAHKLSRMTLNTHVDGLKDAAIVLKSRTGTRIGEDRIHWSNWAESRGVHMTAGPISDFVQWSMDILPASQSPGTVNSVTMEFK